MQWVMPLLLVLLLRLTQVKLRLGKHLALYLWILYN
uniref:Uncharacterized protein n=1 Tax=Picea sitchensis TaxID=3332 RepID=A0A6B9XVJ2_PICSI|nr:hypothetical protein Q903MT_gene4364 [Picea sitchensis]